CTYPPARTRRQDGHPRRGHLQPGTQADRKRRSRKYQQHLPRARQVRQAGGRWGMTATAKQKDPLAYASGSFVGLFFKHCIMLFSEIPYEGGIIMVDVTVGDDIT